MNMPKITFKKAFFRIFWKILAKTGPQSLYLCGFPEARVEMKVAPFRALTLFSGTPVQHLILCRNGGRPFRALTLKSGKIRNLKHLAVEMEVAPFRASTQPTATGRTGYSSVEMEVAPFSALTHHGFHIEIILFIRQ